MELPDSYSSEMRKVHSEKEKVHSEKEKNKNALEYAHALAEKHGFQHLTRVVNADEGKSTYASIPYVPIL